MNLRCLIVGHDTRIVTEGDEGRIECRRCKATIGDPWPLLRPEVQIAAQRQHEAVMRDRERRSRQMRTPAPSKIVRIR